MGNFYTNYTLRGPTPEAVVEALRGRTAAVTPEQNGCVVAFDEQADSQDLAVFAQVGMGLSGRLKCPSLAVLNHDDDVLLYRLYVDGKLVDEYDSWPGYPAPAEMPAGGDARRLCRAFCVNAETEVAEILSKPQLGPNGYLFALQRHAALVAALGISPYAVGAGFSYIGGGELPSGLDAEALLWTQHRRTRPSRPC